MADAPITPPVAAPPVALPSSYALVAPWWHTAGFVALLLLLSFSRAGQHQGFIERFGRPTLYLQTIAFEFIMLGIVYLGLRLGKVPLREIIGGGWKNFEDFLFDVGIAGLFWIIAFIVLAATSWLLGVQKGGLNDPGAKTILMMAPQGLREMLLWAALSTTAGFCEEIIFRGYFQRQFTAFTQSVWVGIVLQAVMFGAGHGYEGWKRMIVIGVFGAMFGVLTHLRKSLRPGMMAHAWHDGIAGILLSFLSKVAK